MSLIKGFRQREKCLWRFTALSPSTGRFLCADYATRSPPYAPGRPDRASRRTVQGGPMMPRRVWVETLQVRPTTKRLRRCRGDIKRDKGKKRGGTLRRPQRRARSPRPLPRRVWCGLDQVCKAPPTVSPRHRSLMISEPSLLRALTHLPQTLSNHKR